MSAAKIFAGEFTEDSLHNIYAEYISITSAIGVDRLSRTAFEDRLNSEVELIAGKVHAGTYRFSQYKEKLISKGAEKLPRVISIPTYRDRITLRALCNVLKKSFDSQLNVRLPQHTVSELRVALANGNYNHFLKLDVSNFYPSIDHTILRTALKRKIRKTELHQLITSAIESPTVAFPDRSKPKSDRGVPQGLAISNILAEIYLSKFDTWAKNIPNVGYFRYVDDIFFLAKNDPVPLFESIKLRLFDQFGLRVHELGNSGKSVSGPVTDKFHFLGYEFEHGKARVKIDSMHRIEASLAKILTTYKYKCAASQAAVNPFERSHLLAKAAKICAWRLNLRVTGCLFDDVRRGWVFYFSQIDEEALAQLHHLDKTLRVLARRFAFDPKDLKSFVRTFHESKRSNLSQRYIPNFDATSVAEQRDILEMYGMEGVATMTDVQVTRAFKRRIRKETSQLEQDVQGGSRG